MNKKRGVLLVDKFIQAVQQCTLLLTNTAKDALCAHFRSEHTLFETQPELLLYIEKRAQHAPGETNVTIYIDGREHDDLQPLLGNRIAVLHAVLRNTGFLATGFYIADTRFPLQTTRRLHARVTFNTRTTNAQMPIPFYKALRQLPNAEEQQQTIKKRIASWEGYLKIQEQNASIDDIEATYKDIHYNDDFTRMTMQLQQLSPKQWRALEGLSVTIPGYGDAIGDVTRAQANRQTIDIELQPRITQRLRKQQLPKGSGAIAFSNFASLSQIRRLRKGFQDLAKGYAANPNLENILFEEIPQIEVPTKRAQLTFHNQLNEYQQEAVIGAMSANDLYCIQGPPGTGKTTVISEICYQNAQAGLKTLVASQSNLAVDNALSRLLAHKDIRILRYGRTESIEEEGKKFIEENIGHYWLSTTRSEIDRHLYSQQAEEQQLQQKLQAIDAQLLDNEQQQKRADEQISEKAAAKIELRTLNSKVLPLHTKIDTLVAPRKQLEQQWTKLSNQYNKLYHQRLELENYIENTLDGSALTAQIEALNEVIQVTQAKRKYLQTEQLYKQCQYEQQQLAAQLADLQYRLSNEQTIIETIQTCTSAQALRTIVEQYTLSCSALAERLLQQAIQQQQQAALFMRLKEVNTRLVSAITFIEQKLGHYANDVLTAWLGTISIEQIDALISAMKTAITTQGRVTFDELGHHLAQLRGAKESLNTQGRALKPQADVYDQTLRQATATIANEIASQLRFAARDTVQLEQQLQSLAQQLQTHEATLAQLSMKFSLPIEEDANLLARLANEYVNDYSALQTQAGTLKQKQAEVATLLTEELPLKEQLDTVRAALDDNLQQETLLMEELEVFEQQRRHYREIAESDPESTLQRLKEAHVELVNAQAQLQLELQQLPIKQALQNEWRSLLDEATDHDVDEIKKLYIKHANVIGTTCVQSARKDFIDSYPEFDVVIIDEVSKATPPELLLPMLKGKKIILVGDHHQLPPLLGDDTLEETLTAVMKDNERFEGRDELESLLRESLFERLFKALPDTNKQMLAIQYRMHAQIMAGITPFYAQQQGGLQCGLTDSDAMRDHYLEGRFMSRHDHLVWLDLPSKAPYFEQRVKDGNSLFNEGELATIRDVLLDMNDATARAKAQGLLPADARKSVGVISFYGEQVKKINRLIQQEVQLPHLHIRTGTVDKFQGMEMDVILVSMVRNVEASKGQIGFARDYRRLNVAVSRARELCMMIGSVEMFTQKERSDNARLMYKTLYDTIHATKGIRQIEAVEVS